MDKRIQNYFKSYADIDTLYVAGDGQAFKTESKAINHSKTLPKDQQKVTTYTRKEYEAAIAEKPKKESTGKTASKGKTADAAKTDEAGAKDPEGAGSEEKAETEKTEE